MEPNKTMNVTLIISIIIIAILIVGGFYILNSNTETSPAQVNTENNTGEQSAPINEADTKVLESLEQDLGGLDTTTDLNFDGVE